MTARTERGLTLKWMSFLTLLIVLPLIITDLTIVQVYHEGLKGSDVVVQGMALIAGILLGFLCARRLTSPKGPTTPNSEECKEAPINDKEEYFKDISYRRRMEEELKRSEERYRTIVESIQDGYFEIDPAGNYTFANDAEGNILGYTKEELIGINYRQYQDEATRKKTFKAFSELYSRDQPIRALEMEVIRKDGSKGVNEISASVIRDEQGKPVGFRGITRDITQRKQMEEALRLSEEKARQLSQENAVMAEIGRIVSSTLNIGEVYERFTEEVRKLLPFDRIVINTIDIEKATVINVHIAGKGIVDRKIGEVYPLEGSGNAEMVRTKSSLLVQTEDFNVYKDHFPALLSTFQSGFRSIMNVPLFSKGRIIGGLLLRSLKPYAYTDKDVRLAERVSSQIAGAIANAQLFTERKQAGETVERLSQENAVMAEIGRIVSSTLNIGEVYERFVEEVRKLLPFDRVSVNTMNPDRGSVTIAYVSGVKIADAQEGTLVTMESPFYEDIVNRGSSVLIQPRNESELAGRYPNFVRHFRAGLRSMIATPLVSKNQVVGILHIQSLKPDAYTESDVRLAERVGNQIAGAIANAQLFSERKRAEEALRESEARLQVQINRMPIGCIVWDREFRVLSWNPAAERIFGFTAEEAFGRHPYSFIVPKAAQPPIDTIWRRLLDGDTTAHSLNENNTKDGRIIICDWSNTPLQEGNGTVIGVLSMVQDITDRKRAEEALRQSEEKYRTILENMQEVYYEIDLAGNWIFLNEAFYKHLGYTKEELIGKKSRQYQDETTAGELYQAYTRLYRTGEPIKAVEAVWIRKDGAKRTYEMSASLIRDSKGKPIGFRGISRDITERKQAEEALRQSEEKYRTILESIEDGYYEVDLAGNLTFFNDSMCRIWGYPKEELMGMNNRQYTDQENARRVYQAFNRVYRTGEPGRELDWEIIRKGGTKRFIEASVSLRKDTFGKPIGFRGIIRDITDRKRIEEQLLQAEKLRAVGEMASGVAHDFNNALAAILGNTQLLLYTAQDGELKETLKIIEQVAKDSSRTVRRLQDFTRRSVPQELSKIDINSIIKDSTEITKPKWKDEAQSRGVAIEIVSNLEDIPLASGSASELREVITNMIFNAVEALPEGGRIEIHTFKKGRDIYIQISDTGVGIPEEAKMRIFEPFFTTKPFTNTGLGLSMSYGIVKRFGGEIEVESKVGQGTTFTITLPMGEEGEEEAVNPQLIKKGRKAHILVIDDEELVRSVLCRTLAQADHQVTLAEDGRKGVQLFKEGRFDIVLTDLGMPGVSGWEVCRMIKEISPHTSVGMITGWGDERNRSKMEEYGLDFFISKPFDFAQILNVVAETMESKEE